MYDDQVPAADVGEPPFNQPRNAAFRRFHRIYILGRLALLDGVARSMTEPVAIPLPSYAGYNIKMLGQLLNLSEVERTWLLWAYCEKDCGLPHVQVADASDACQMLAKLWDQPVEAVLAAASPNRLRALELLNGVRATPDERRQPFFLCLSDFLSMPEAAAEFISRPHRSHGWPACAGVVQ